MALVVSVIAVAIVVGVLVEGNVVVVFVVIVVLVIAIGSPICCRACTTKERSKFKQHIGISPVLSATRPFILPNPLLLS